VARHEAERLVAGAEFHSDLRRHGYADYGLCGGVTSTFSGVGGKLNAIQPKLGTYNFEFLFTGLTPATEYKLLATRDAVPSAAPGSKWVGRSRMRLGPSRSRW
jgi:hypothetical protein